MTTTALECQPQIMNIEAPRARVIRHVKDLIREGEVLQGQPLPSARSMAQQLRVNHRTVNLALQMLVDEGLIRSNGGKLRMVAEPKAALHSSAWMRDAVIVLSSDAVSRFEHREHGWREFITLSALQKVQAQNRPAILLGVQQHDLSKLQDVLASSPAGLLVLETEGARLEVSEIFQMALQRGVACVVYGDHPEAQSYDRVSSDHEAGAYQLTRWLLSQGRTRIGRLGLEDVGSYWLRQRRRGYERAMREAGLEPLPDILSVKPSQEARTDLASHERDFHRVTRHWAGYLAEHLVSPQPLDALLVPSDGDVYSVNAACRMLGREPGGDVLAVGYDNYWAEVPEAALESCRPAATIDKRNDLIGAMMVELLVERLAGHLPPEPQRRLIPPQLIVPS